MYDVTYGHSLVNPKRLENNSVITALKRKLHSKTYNRLIKTIDEAVDAEVDEGDGKLVWTKSGKMFGHKSIRPKKDVDHLWDSIISIVGDDEMCLIALGTLLRWRMSLRPEQWLVYRRETETIGLRTGRPIHVSEYWISN
jgi:hypothetical protein